MYFCLFFPGEVAKKSKGIKDAEKANIQVVDEGFLDAVKKGGAVLLIQSHSMVPWGSDVRMAFFFQMSMHWDQDFYVHWISRLNLKNSHLFHLMQNFSCRINFFFLWKLCSHQAEFPSQERRVQGKAWQRASKMVGTVLIWTMEVRYSTTRRFEAVDTMHFLQQSCLLMTTKYRARFVDRYEAYIVELICYFGCTCIKICLLHTVLLLIM